MSLRSSLEPFVARPRSSAALAVLFIVLGVVSISGLVSLSPNRRYFPGHEWILASLSWVIAVLFGYGALKGMKSRSRPGER
jgi:threonine/homoserine/homoserine lactone efflux protein